jgi:hypothetical protein
MGSIGHHNPFAIGVLSMLGQRIINLEVEIDYDEHDNERITPVGSVGQIARLNHVDDDFYYDVLFPNGAWIVLSSDEIKNPTKYQLVNKP